MSARRANVLVKGLGPDSALFRSANPDQIFWNQEHELLALNVEVTHQLFRAVYGALKDRNAALPRPLQIPRPGATKAKRGTTLDELHQMFADRVKPKE